MDNAEFVQTEQHSMDSLVLRTSSPVQQTKNTHKDCDSVFVRIFSTALMEFVESVFPVNNMNLFLKLVLTSVFKTKSTHWLRIPVFVTWDSSE